ncbi:MAG: ABC transporter substrate-binding protein/permease [Oscillospiraceae bacterium]|jgi:His/Glu/Gln/Arg/opine family amino acid ABC transporter permease subunit|nr:ABC transporter substrate-binding protein/permease [Oscillospiraceae bacterium]
MNLKKFSFFFVFIFLLTIFFKNFDFSSEALENYVEKIKKSSEIKVVTNAEFFPFEFVDSDGKIKGIDIDISEKIAEKIGVKLKVDSVSFDSILIEIENGSSNLAIAALTSTPERAKNLEFSDPYFKSTQKILANKNSNINTLEDLAGKKLGVQLGTTSDSYCSSKEKTWEVVRFSSPAEAAMSLSSSNIDAVVVDNFTADGLMNSKENSFKKLGYDLTDEEYVIGAPKGETGLIKIVNETIKNLKESGELKKIVDKYKKIATKENSAENSNDSSSSDNDSNNNTNNSTSNVSNSNNNYTGLILDGFKNTIILTVCSILIGIVLGAISSMLRVYSEDTGKSRILLVLSNLYTTVIRGTPVVIQLFIMYHVVLSFLKISDKFLAAILAFGINSGAYVSEIIRSGIRSVDKGQLEASRSLGLSYKISMINIVMPQAIKNILPTLMSEFISLLKETSIVGVIGLIDLTRAGDIMRSITYEAFTPLFITASIYLLVVVVLTRIFSLVEKN